MAINEKEFENFVFLIALENAINFNGKTNPKALLGKCVSKFPLMKEDMAYYMNQIESIVNQVNEMNSNDQEKKLEWLDPNYLKEKAAKKEEKKESKKTDFKLPELAELKKDHVVTRFSPAPSGYLHLGHLFGIVFNYEYVRNYGGKFILRLEDTNPENIDLKNYESIIEDVKWISDNSVSDIIYQSDRINIYYKYLRQLVETGKVYVCKCDSEISKAFNDSSAACPHREIPIKDQLEEYEKMLNGTYKDGDAVVRFKSDLNDKNPALRDFPLARINTSSHARVGNKYRLWPMYNMCTAVDDALMDITHVIRGKDHEINGIRQDMIKDALHLKKAVYFHYGRIKFEDIVLSKTELSQKITDKIYDGWEDPRVPSLISYRKRGYKAEAFRNMIVTDGMSKRDSKITDEEYHKSLNFFNKQILEKEADRYFFVHNPKEIIIENIDEFKEKEIELPKHPEDKSKGVREFKVINEYVIDGIDFNEITKGEIIRLMHFANFKVLDKKENKLILEFISKDYDKALHIKKNIHFLPKTAEKCYIILQDNSKLKGQCEYMDNIKEDTSIQFERFGFVKFDHKDEKSERVFYFTHR